MEVNGGSVAAAELPELLTLQQASKILKVHPNTLRNWERAGVIPVVRVGPRRDRRFPKHGIHQFLPGGSQQTSTPATPGESVAAQPASEVTAALEQGTSIPVQSVPTVTEQEIPVTGEAAGEAEESAEAVESPETPHVIVNVPPKRSIFSIVAVAFVSLAALAGIVYFVRLAAQEVPGDAASFAIRRNPPRVIFADSFEAYDANSLPRPTWNTIGVWKVLSDDGNHFLRGEQKVDNPLDLLAHAYTGSSTWKDYRFKFNTRVVSGARPVTALVDYLDEKNYYAVVFDDTSVTVNLVREGKSSKLGSADITARDGLEWHTYEIDLFGDDLDVQVEGQRVLGVTDVSLTTGKVALVAAGQTVDFDEVQVLETDGEVGAEN